MPMWPYAWITAEDVGSAIHLAIQVIIMQEDIKHEYEMSLLVLTADQVHDHTRIYDPIECDADYWDIMMGHDAA